VLAGVGETDQMASCPYCREEVKDGALKCRYCQSPLAPIIGTPADEKPFTISIDQRLKSSVALLISILSAMIVVGAILYGVDINKAREDLDKQRQANLDMRQLNIDTQTASGEVTKIRDAAKKLLDDTTKDLTDTKKLVEDVKKEAQATQGQVEETQKNVNLLSQDLQSLRGGGAQYDSLANALTTISNTQKSIDLLDRRVSALEDILKNRTIESLPHLPGPPPGPVPPQLTEAERPEIEAASHVHQRALPASAVSPVDITKEGPTSPGRSLFQVEYTVLVDDTDLTRLHGRNDLIERVVYTLDKRWFSNPEIVSINRADNFKMSVRVWGATNVEVAIFVRGLDKPIVRKNTMSLSNDITF